MKWRGALAAAFAGALAAGCATQPPAQPRAASESGMLQVPGGRFTMGRDTGELNEQPAHTVAVDAYAMDRTEVAASDFAEFLNAAGNPDERYFTADEYATVVAVPSRGGNAASRFAARPGYERYPANNVSWQGANAYCRWRGKTLPTETEWEKAARGADKRLFPWGKREPDEEHAQFAQVWQQKQFDVFVPVDDLPGGSSPYGLLNMAGNVLEWVNDWYRQNYLDFCNPGGEVYHDLVTRITGGDTEIAAADPAATGGTTEDPEVKARRARQIPPRDNPIGPDTGGFKVLRGGSWQDRQEADLSTTHRFWLDPAQRFPHTGFRCSKASPRTP